MKKIQMLTLVVALLVVTFGGFCAVKGTQGIVRDAIALRAQGGTCPRPHGVCVTTCKYNPLTKQNVCTTVCHKECF